MTTATLNRTAFDAKAGLVLQRRGEARVQATLELAGVVVNHVVQHARRDTQRFVRGAALAGNAAGVTTITPPPIIPSKRYGLWLKLLTAQYNKWKALDELYRKEGRTKQNYYKKIKRRVAQTERELNKLDPTSLVIGKSRKNAHHFLTVRNKTTYGGEGGVVQAGDRTLVWLKVTEPHASIVEHRFKPFKRAIDAARGLGMRGKKVSRAYLKKATAGTGWMPGIR